jgi:hypothetical protein
MRAWCSEDLGSARVSRDWFRRRAETIFHRVIYLPVAVVQEEVAIATRALPQVRDERRALLGTRSLDYSNIASAREARRLER